MYRRLWLMWHSDMTPVDTITQWREQVAQLWQKTADFKGVGHFEVITLVFRHRQWLVGDDPFRLKFALKVTHPFKKTPTSTDFRLLRLNREK